MSEVVYYTEEGLEKLKADLDQLKTVERSNVARQIAEARDKGDLSENAEYDAAKEAQGLLEAKIAKLEAEFSKARILDESQIDTSKVLIMSTPFSMTTSYMFSGSSYFVNLPFAVLLTDLAGLIVILSISAMQPICVRKYPFPWISSFSLF